MQLQFKGNWEQHGDHWITSEELATISASFNSPAITLNIKESIKGGMLAVWIDTKFIAEVKTKSDDPERVDFYYGALGEGPHTISISTEGDGEIIFYGFTEVL